MLYVITEDTNSGREFWRIALTNILGLDKFTIVEFCKNVNGVDITGNHGLERQVNKVLTETAKVGDCIFVALDNIGQHTRIDPKTGTKHGFDSGDFIANTAIKCQNAQVGFLYTAYYCFEELFLSYLGLEELCQIDSRDNKLSEVITYVKDCIDNGKEYYSRKNKHVQYVISIRQDADKNKEHFADALLYQATRNIKHGEFRISKEVNGLGKCWICGCQQPLNIKNATFNCEHCCYRVKKQSTLEKLLDIDKNSLLRFYPLNLQYLINTFH